MYFQDDGSRTLHFAPYSANTGFYFVRNNERTKYFFNSLLMAGDLVISTFSHQTALVALLAEHSSMYGLKVKVWSRDKEEFPGGVHYHQRPTFMKQMINGTVHPYIFHMSWYVLYSILFYRTVLYDCSRLLIYLTVHIKL